MSTKAFVAHSKTLSASVDPVDLFLGDKLAEYIIQKLGRSPIKTGLIATSFAFLSSAILALINHRFRAGGNYISLTQDWSYLITELFTNPLVWGYYVWACYAPFTVLHKLDEGKILKKDREKNDPRLAILTDKRWPIVAFVLSLIVGYAYFSGSIDWLNTRATFILRIVLVVIPGAYAAAMTAIRVILATRLFKISMAEMSLHPLHPDKVGGLRPLADYSMKITWAIISFGIMGALLEISDILRNRVGESYFVHGTFLVYLLVAPVVFFFPLSIAHEAMRTAKEKFLLEVSHRFNELISEMRSEIKSTQYDLQDNLKKIEQLKSVHQIGSEFPVWPFDFATIRRFSLSILSPIATFAFPFLVKFFLMPFLALRLPAPLYETIRSILEKFR